MFTTELKTFKKSLCEVQAVIRPIDNYPCAKITCARDASNFLRPLWPVPLNYREAFISLNLNRSNNTISYGLISIGGVSSTCVDPKIILQHALLSNASSIILAHNHPSGNIQPSQLDLSLTRKIKSACSYMDIALLDHVILVEEPGAYYSMADEGVI